MVKFEEPKKIKKKSIQFYVAPDVAAAIQTIGKGSYSLGIKIIIDSVKEDIFRAANAKKKAS